MPLSNTKNTNTPLVQLGTLCLAKGLEQGFLIEQNDLNEHFYVIGRSGTGKSNLLTQLAIADMNRGSGICFIDPIGTGAEELLTHVLNGNCTCNPKPIIDAADRDVITAATRRGKTRITAANRDQQSDANADTESCNCCRRSRDKDVIYIDAADVEYPIGINPLYNISKADRARVVSDILQMFEGIWHNTGWGPRMESIFRATLHTLVENPHCMRPSLLTVFRLLLDSEFRNLTKQDIDNSQLLDWWDYRFDRGDLNERTRREGVEPVLNKIDNLSLYPLIRNIIGQPRCVLDFDEIIRRKQILIVNLNQNKIGQDNASFIGMLIISRIRQAAAKMGKPEHAFALTLDEAHSFPTMELTKIITQGRHNGLFARIAHQNLEQFDPKISASLRNGCGSLAVFAVGHRDAETLVDDMESQHRDRALDMMRNLQNGEAVMRLTRSGAPMPLPSSPIKIARPELGPSKPQSAINRTREAFATGRLTAEFQIATAHDQLNRQEHLNWQAKFKQEKRVRGKQQRKNIKAKMHHPE